MALLITVAARGADGAKPPIYTYALVHETGQWNFDEAMTVSSLQGLINRQSPELFVLSRKNARAQYWLDLMSKDGRWLEGREHKPLADVNAIVKLAGPRVKGVVIWDPGVPATANIATTVAAVHDAVVLSPELADRYLWRWKLPVIVDLRGKFTGAETGSRKNDAYRWAIREYLAKGKCSSHLLCLFEDSYAARSRGDISYAVTRDWAAKNQAFVFDLSPWADEKPGDDPDQKLGTDAETYKMILAEAQRQAGGQHMTEVTGFFAMSKYSNQADHPSSHEPVPTEWESVWIMSPYNCYQNTISSDCMNQSFHSHAPRKPLKQKREDQPIKLEDKTYVAVLMADYDSATPLYDFLPELWHDAGRGKLPLAWGVNPNLLECYPDLVAYLYDTATPNDTFTSDASCAGYINPNRIAKDSLPLFVKHNQQFFRQADMTIAPMVLDRDQPTPEVKDAFAQFAPDGFATIVANVLGGRGTYPPPQVWKGMPILELFNDTCNSKDPDHAANAMAAAIANNGGGAKPGFFLFRHVWVSPTHVANSLAAMTKAHPEWNVEVVDARSLFALFKQSRDAKK